MAALSEEIEQLRLKVTALEKPPAVATSKEEQEKYEQVRTVACNRL